MCVLVEVAKDLRDASGLDSLQHPGLRWSRGDLDPIRMATNIDPSRECKAINLLTAVQVVVVLGGLFCQHDMTQRYLTTTLSRVFLTQACSHALCFAGQHVYNTM